MQGFDIGGDSIPGVCNRHSSAYAICIHRMQTAYRQCRQQGNIRVAARMQMAFARPATKRPLEGPQAPVRARNSAYARTRRDLRRV